MHSSNPRFSGVQPSINFGIIPNKDKDSTKILFFSTCCPFLTDGIEVSLTADTDDKIDGEDDLNLVVNSNREFLNKLAAIEKIDTCDSTITINVLNAKVTEVLLYVFVCNIISDLTRIFIYSNNSVYISS